MSEETTDQVSESSEAPAQAQTDEQKPEIDWKAKAREWERRAKENKSAADKLAEIEEANKSEVQRAADKVAALEAELSTVRLDSLRRKVAADNGITDSDDIDLFLTGSDEATLTKQAKRLAERTADRKKQSNVVPREGATSPSTVEGAERETVRGLFGGGS
jgi:hypothetical protein